MPRKPPITAAKRAAILTALREGAPAHGATRRAAQLTGASLADVRRVAVEAGVRSSAGRLATVATVITLRLTAEQIAALTVAAGGRDRVPAFCKSVACKAAGLGEPKIDQ